MNRYLGIDVSKNNGVLDWDTIKNSEIDYAIIRVGYGSDIEQQDDVQAIRNMQECDRLGIPYGVYLYSYALSTNEATSEANHAVRMVQGFNPTLGIWFDMEDADGYKEEHGINVYESRELLTDICDTFCSAIVEAGYTTGIYANKDYWDNVLLQEHLADFPVWLAHWRIDEPSMACLMWQYTSNGEVSGSSPRTDLNYYYGELPEGKTKEAAEEKTEDGLADNTLRYSVGDSIEYDKIYTSSTSAEALKPTYTSGIITKIVEGARNPYLIGDGTGWVNDDCIVTENAAEEPERTITTGDKVIFTGDTDYNGISVKAYHNDTGYIVTQLDGDRAVLTYNGDVFAAVYVTDLELA